MALYIYIYIYIYCPPCIIRNTYNTVSKKSKLFFWWTHSFYLIESFKYVRVGWWMVHTTVLHVSTVFMTVFITIAAALASSPEVGSSMNYRGICMKFQLQLLAAWAAQWIDQYSHQATHLVLAAMNSTRQAPWLHQWTSDTKVRNTNN